MNIFMEDNTNDNKQIISKMYFESNQIIVSRFFEEQRKMFERQSAGIQDTEKTKMFAHLMELNKSVILSALEAQKCGISFCYGDSQSIGLAEQYTLESIEATLNSNSFEVQEGINKTDFKDNRSSRDIFEDWIKTELSRITGFPGERITGEMKFEEDLGLVSIDMVELFSHFVEEFPYLNRDVSDVIAATSVDELLNIVTLEEETTTDLSSEILKWLKTEVSKITGFPEEGITREMKFEEDLGLVSIDMIELFSRFTQEFSDLNKDMEDIIGADSIDSFIKIVAGDGLSKENDTVEIDMGEPEVGVHDEIQWLISEIKTVISRKTNIPIENITLETNLDSINIDIFTLEEIYDELLSSYGQYMLFKQEILYATNLNHVEKLLNYFILEESENSTKSVNVKHEIIESDSLADIRRYGFNYEKMDICETYQLPEKILLVGTKNDMFDYFNNQLKSNGVDVITVHITDNGWKTKNMNSETIKYDDMAKFLCYLESNTDDFGNLPSVIFLAEDNRSILDTANYSEWNSKIEQSVIALFVISCIYSKTKENKKITNFVSIIGESSSCTISSASRGLVRTMAHDLKDKYHVRSIWLEDDYKSIPIGNIYSALITGPNSHDIFISSSDVKIRTLYFPPVKSISKNTIEIDEKSLIVVFGGGSGISSEIACAMAEKYKLRIIVVGRTEFSTDCLYEDIQDDQNLKQKIFNDLSMKLNGDQHVTRDILEKETRRVSKQRQILNTKSRIEKAGGEFHYYTCDISKYNQLNDLLNIIHERHGKITGIIHGAGEVNGQRNKTLDSFRNNLYIKTSSMFSLYHFFKKYPLKFAIFFSSISAYTGLPRLSDYSASNEFINGFTTYWNKQVEYPTLSIMWSLWTETGIMKNSTNNVQKMGLEGISNSQGVDLFFRELENIDKSLDCVLLTHDSMLEFSMPN